jgi:hypothetical protein
MSYSASQDRLHPIGCSDESTRGLTPTNTAHAASCRTAPRVPQPALQLANRAPRGAFFADGADSLCQREGAGGGLHDRVLGATGCPDEGVRTDSLCHLVEVPSPAHAVCGTRTTRCGASAKPLGYGRSYLACTIGQLVPIWQPSDRSTTPGTDRQADRHTPCGSHGAESGTTETNRMQLVLFCTRNRTFGTHIWQRHMRSNSCGAPLELEPVLRSCSQCTASRQNTQGERG